MGSRLVAFLGLWRRGYVSLSSVVLLLWLLIPIAGCISVAALGTERPRQVFVFNGGRGGYDGNALGYIWQQLGFINPDTGEQATIDADGNVILGGRRVGKVIKNQDGSTKGYSNADGSKEAYDLSNGATANEAWNRVADGGSYVIAKHGARSTDNPEPGGGVHLDGGVTYDGFKPTGGSGGTGCGFRGGAYPLDPRPGANISVKVWSCWSSSDPNPKSNDKRSVTDSASDVPGVGGVTGTPGEAEINMGGGFASGNREQRAKAREILFKAAKDAGFHKKDGSVTWDEVFLWIRSLPFLDRLRTINDLIRDTGATFGLRYDKKNILSSFDSSLCPVMYLPGFPMHLGFSEEFSSVGASVDADGNESFLPRMFNIHKLSVPPLGFVPPGSRLTSGVFDFRDLPINPPLEEFLTYTLECEGNPRVIRPFFFDPITEVWMPINLFNIDKGNLVTELAAQGILAAYEFVEIADVTGIQVTYGNLLEEGNLSYPDETEMITASAWGTKVSEPMLTTVVLRLNVSSTFPYLDVRIEPRLGIASSGTLKLSFLNTQTGLYDELGEFAINRESQVLRIYDIESDAYVSNGIVQVQVKSIVHQTLLAPTFLTYFDWFEVTSHQ